MSTNIKETQKVTIQEVVNEETGEVSTVVASHEITTQKYYTNTDEFIQVYLKDISGVIRVSSKAEIQVLAHLWKCSNYTENDKENGNCVVLSAKVIDDIKEETGLTEASIRNLISKLSKPRDYGNTDDTTPLLIKHKKFRGTYYLNPTYFFKGKLKDRPKAIRYVIEYLYNGREDVF